MDGQEPLLTYSVPVYQAATGVGPPGGGSGPPREGDGFTFEHVAEKRELWIDFCADTGDGGCASLLLPPNMFSSLVHLLAFDSRLCLQRLHLSEGRCRFGKGLALCKRLIYIYIYILRGLLLLDSCQLWLLPYPVP